MKCIKCNSTIQDKKFEHPILKDEYLCLNCFDSKLHSNRITLSNNIVLAADHTEASLKDDLLINFILCTTGGNRNKDGFDDEGLSTDYKTVINQRFDWEHTDEVIGTITDSEFVSASDTERIKELGVDLKKSFVRASGMIWKVWNLDRVKEVVERHRFGTLFCSMEDLFDYCICTECRKEYAFEDEYCEHLSDRFSLNSKTFRILRGNKVVGAGVVRSPADRDAVGLAVAKDKMRYSIISQVLDPDVYDYYVYMKQRLGV